MSLLEFEHQSKGTQLDVLEIRRDNKGVALACCVRLRSPGIDYMPSLCFFREEPRGKWFFASIGRFCG